MLRIIAILSILFSVTSSFVFSAESTAGLSDASSALEMKTLKVLDSSNIRILFSEAVDPTSVVLKIAKQSDNSSIDIAEIITTVDDVDSLDVKLDEDLDEGTSYTMTVLAAVGVSGSTITDGGNALKEFVTPSPLKKANPTLNAPANPTAVTIKDDEIKTDVKKPVAVPSFNEDEEELVATEELPLTGMNPLVFLFIVLPLAYIFIRKRTA